MTKTRRGALPTYRAFAAETADLTVEQRVDLAVKLLFSDDHVDADYAGYVINLLVNKIDQRYTTPTDLPF